jgi:MerR family transcriptional regulator/heat shock protein HspR
MRRTRISYSPSSGWRHITETVQETSTDRNSNGIGRESIPAEHQSQLEGVYVISVAARLLEVHPQTLRKYERVGLINPARTVGVRRLYSEEDIARLRVIKHLVDDLGLNLAGVELILDILNRLIDIQISTHQHTSAKTIQAEVDSRLKAIFNMLKLSN